MEMIFDFKTHQHKHQITTHLTSIQQNFNTLKQILIHAHREVFPCQSKHHSGEEWQITREFGVPAS